MGAKFAQEYNKNPQKNVFTHLTRAFKLNFTCICIGVPLNAAVIAA